MLQAIIYKIWLNVVLAHVKSDFLMYIIDYQILYSAFYSAFLLEPLFHFVCFFGFKSDCQ